MSDYTWKRFGGYDCSSRGDKRFSAFYARMPDDARSIEEQYQCDVKGYDPGGRNWRLGKGKPPLVLRDTWPEYLALWIAWAEANSPLIEQLRKAVEPYGNVVSDRFANGPINQARALAHILNMV